MYIYSYLISGVPKYLFLLSMHMYLDFDVETTLFQKMLAVVVSAVGVLTIPG